MIIAGIDAGSTKTRVVLAEENGVVLGQGTAGTCNLVVVDEERASRNLGIAFQAAAKAAGLPQPTVIDSVFLGGAGIVTSQDKDASGKILKSLREISCKKIEAANDIELVLAGGLGESEGIALISGTGSSCLGRRFDGRRWQAGGREWLVDDRGSGFRLGLEGIIAAVRAADGRDIETTMQSEIFEALGIQELDDVIRRLHGVGGNAVIEKREVAALAPIVIAAAEAGDGSACAIIEKEVSELAHMVFTVAVNLEFTGGEFRWTVAGSVGNAPFILQRLREIVCARLPFSRFVFQQLPPEYGAVVLAARLAGLHPDAGFVNRLQSAS